MECDKTKFIIRTWKNWTILHWILNPALVINELLLGQREPKILLIDKTTDKPLMERQFVPCPHCGHLNDGRLWSKKNAFGNWFGLYCPNCGKSIPCVRNFTSLIIIILTFPIWIWFVKRLKKNWLSKQPARFENLNIEEIKHENISWIKLGSFWGGFMYIFMIIVNPLIDGDEKTLKRILVGIPIWIIGGLGFGYMMKYLMGKKVKSKTK